MKLARLAVEVVILAVFFAILAYGFHIQNPWVPFAFLTGGFFSGLAGFVGMKTATYASARTANAVTRSLNSGLKLAFRSGAVMGLTVVGLGLLDISIWYVVLKAFVSDPDPSQVLVTITTTMLTFGMGASTQALFARVGGGIYTKAVDVGADIVGKVEADIPEDDPRNPAIMLDNNCSFLCTDFDDKSCKHGYKDDVLAFVGVCRDWQIPYAIERSRSGNGAHVWIFFEEPLPAFKARRLGNAILTESMNRDGRMSFHSYDRFFPNQDRMPEGGFGNLVALPLQGQARKNLNTVFVDDDFLAYKDQWPFLYNIKKLREDSAA